MISNRRKAYILERAREHKIMAKFVRSKGKTREQFDGDVIKILQSKQVRTERE